MGEFKRNTFSLFFASNIWWSERSRKVPILLIFLEKESKKAAYLQLWFFNDYVIWKLQTSKCAFDLKTHSFQFLNKNHHGKSQLKVFISYSYQLHTQIFPKYLTGFLNGRTNCNLHSCGRSSSKKRLFFPLPENVYCPMFPETATDYYSTRNSNSCLSIIWSLIFSTKVMNVSSKSCRILGATNHNRPHLDPRIKMLIVLTIKKVKLMINCIATRNISKTPGFISSINRRSRQSCICVGRLE